MDENQTQKQICCRPLAVHVVLHIGVESLKAEVDLGRHACDEDAALEEAEIERLYKVLERQRDAALRAELEPGGDDLALGEDSAIK